MWIKRENEIECLVRQVHRWNIRPYYWKSYGGFIRFPLYRWVSRRNLSRLLASWIAQLSVLFSYLLGVHLSLVTILHTSLVQSSTYPLVLCFFFWGRQSQTDKYKRLRFYSSLAIRIFLRLKLVRKCIKSSFNASVFWHLLKEKYLLKIFYWSLFIKGGHLLASTAPFRGYTVRIF